MDQVPQIHLPPNIVLALSKHHASEQIHDRLSPSLLSHAPSMQNSGSTLGCNQDDLKISNGSKPGIHNIRNSLELRNWDPSNENVNVALVANIDQPQKLPVGVSAVEMIYDGDAMRHRIG